MVSLHTQNFVNPVTFGYGALTRLPKLIGRFGIKRPLVCADKGVADAGLLDEVLGHLPDGVEPVPFTDTPSNPTEAAVRQAAKRYTEQNCDGLIGLGGGSPIDLAKVVGIAVTHDQPLLNYSMGVPKPERVNRIPPLIAIPTTAGTGAESSPGGVIVMDNGRKLVFGSAKIIPAAAICDPGLTLGLPQPITAATGMDAVTHCIEGYLSPVIHPPADAVALEGVYRAVGQGWLERAVNDGTDRDARWHMMMAAQEGAIAFTKPLGAVHAVSHACGRLPELNLHHGLLNALFLPDMLMLCTDAAPEKFSRLSTAMGLAEGADLAAAIADLNRRIGLPDNLTQLGVTKAMIPDIVEHAMGDLCHPTNLVSMEPQDYANVLDRLTGM